MCGWTEDNKILRQEILRAVDADITSICETHLSGSSVIEIDEYKWIGFNRREIHINAPKASGGVGVLIKDWVFNVYNVTVEDKSYEGILAVKFTHKESGRNFVIFSCYLPPENSARGRDSSSFFVHLLLLIYLYSECDSLYVTGDFNARIGSLSDLQEECDSINERTALDKTVNQHGHEFLEFLNESKMCVLNGRFDSINDGFTSISKKGKAVVDYICVPHDVIDTCSYFKVLTVQSIIERCSLHGLLGERSRPPDHSVLIAEFKADCSMQTKINTVNNGKVKYKLKKIPADFMTSDLSRQAIANIIDSIENTRENQTRIDDIYHNLCSIIKTEMEAKIPKYNTAKQSNKRYKPRKPFWNDELQRLWNKMYHTEKDFLKFKGPNQGRQRLRQVYISARNAFDKHLRQSERTYRRSQAIDIEETRTTNPTEFWKKIQNLGPKRSKVIPIEVVDENGNIVRDEEAVYTKWQQEFQDLYNCTENTQFDIGHYERSITHKLLLENNMTEPLYNTNSELNSNVTLDEVECTVRNAKSGSASGIDDIPYDVLKNDTVIKALQQLFQLIFDCSIIPSLWRKAIVCPILKDPHSDKRIPMNYRGVSLLSCISKLYTSFLNKRLAKYLENNDILADEQNGFRKNRSCEEHVLTLSSIIRNNKTVFAAFVDLKRCFDYIDRDLLLYKLLLNKINGKWYNSVKSIYSSSSSCVRLNDITTDWFRCVTGVRQGDTLSPTLFSVFANDLVAEVNQMDRGIVVGDRKLSMLLYADDIVLIAESETDLQSMLDTVNNWCNRWRVIVNANKSKCIHFRSTNTQRSQFVFHIGESKLETIDKYKYLGIIFHEKLNFSYNCDALSKAAGRALGGIISKVHGLKDFGFKSYEKLYNACVTSILDYCASAWGFKNYQKIDNVQHRAMRYFLGVHRFTPVLAMTGDTGWLPSVYRRWGCMLRMWNRIIQMDDTRITRQVFNMDYQKCFRNWSSEIKSIMDTIGCSNTFNNKTVISLTDANRRIREYYNGVWRADIERVPKLRTYKTFKTQVGCEDYIQLNLQKSERSILSQFRAGILPLRIETGRYVGEPAEQRHCTLCKPDVPRVENEQHFLCECERYSELRSNTYRDLFNFDQNLSSEEQLKYLIRSNPRQLSKFLLCAFRLRRTTLYV